MVTKELPTQSLAQSEPSRNESRPRFKPFKPQYQHADSPHCTPYISYGISWENLLKHQDVSALVIVSLILMTSCIIMNIIY